MKGINNRFVGNDDVVEITRREWSKSTRKLLPSGL